jgi:hypothetical protein
MQQMESFMHPRIAVAALLCIVVFRIVIWDMQYEEGGYQNTLAVCTMLRDDAPYLREWILFHRALGVGHFYLYDHGSVDGYARVVEEFVQSGLVTSIPWTSCHIAPEMHRQAPCQVLAMSDCISRTRQDRAAAWTGVFDVDEFMYTPSCSNGSLVRVLAAQPWYVASIVVQGRVSGTQGFETPEEGAASWVTLSYLYRAPKDGKVEGDPIMGFNDAVKSIGRTQHLYSSSVHRFWINPLSILSFHVPIEFDTSNSSSIRLRHYQYKSYDSVRTKVMRNGNPAIAYRADRDYWSSSYLDDEVAQCTRSLGLGPATPLVDDDYYHSTEEGMCAVVVHSNASDGVVKIRKSFWSVRRAFPRAVLIDLVGSAEARAALRGSHRYRHVVVANQEEIDYLSVCDGNIGEKKILWVPRASWELLGENDATTPTLEKKDDQHPPPMWIQSDGKEEEEEEAAYFWFIND